MFGELNDKFLQVILTFMCVSDVSTTPIMETNMLKTIIGSHHN